MIRAKVKSYIVNIVICFLEITFLRRLKLFEGIYHSFWMSQLGQRDGNAYNIQSARDQGVKVGENCRLYGPTSFSTEPYLIEIGDSTIISGNVDFITHDGAVYQFNDGQGDIYGNFGRIKIGRNCFIGFRSVFMPDVQIGDNCLVAAGSVVQSSFPDNSVIMGNPARWVSDIKFYRVSKMNSKGTIRSDEYAFPREEEMPQAHKKQMLVQHFQNVPIRRPRPKRRNDQTSL
ncbi:hypothetical protein DRN70_02175 [Methanosarcinales archaeon]|nr:MAG: hypothetical protein DRN70_02175 [Methanosarcinales archaeon]